jgi:hypothetical protein
MSTSGCFPTLGKQREDKAPVLIFLVVFFSMSASNLQVLRKDG